MTDPRCPFYGFHWPAKGSDLFHSGAGECGLDLRQHHACRMEAQSRSADFHRCEVAGELGHLLEAGRHLIRFHAPHLPADGMPFDAWRDQAMRR